MKKLLILILTVTALGASGAGVSLDTYPRLHTITNSVTKLVAIVTNEVGGFTTVTVDADAITKNCLTNGSDGVLLNNLYVHDSILNTISANKLLLTDGLLNISNSIFVDSLGHVGQPGQVLAAIGFLGGYGAAWSNPTSDGGGFTNIPITGLSTNGGFIDVTTNMYVGSRLFYWQTVDGTNLYLPGIYTNH